MEKLSACLFSVCPDYIELKFNFTNKNTIESPLYLPFVDKVELIQTTQSKIYNIKLMVNYLFLKNLASYLSDDRLMNVN